MTSNRQPTKGQLSHDLPGLTAYVTGHDKRTGEAIIYSRRPVNWQKYDSDNLGMSVAYTNSFPADLNEDRDVIAHDEKVKTGELGLVSGGGTVLRYVDFAPGYTCMMHRTQSIDYGVVLEGQIESMLDSGEIQRMGRGDVMIQRATMHAWRNPSDTEWARMIFCLQDCKPLFVHGERLREDLGRGTRDRARYAELVRTGGQDVDDRNPKWGAEYADDRLKRLTKEFNEMNIIWRDFQTKAEVTGFKLGPQPRASTNAANGTTAGANTHAAASATTDAFTTTADSPTADASTNSGHSALFNLFNNANGPNNFMGEAESVSEEGGASDEEGGMADAGEGVADGQEVVTDNEDGDEQDRSNCGRGACC